MCKKKPNPKTILRIPNLVEIAVYSEDVKGKTIQQRQILAIYGDTLTERKTNALHLDSYGVRR